MDRLNRSVLPKWPPYAVLAATALYLTVRWESIPARWVIHWGPSGAPNGWATRTISGVYGPLMLAAGLLLFLEALSAFVRRRTPEETSTEPLRAATKNLMRAVMLGTAVVLAFLAVDLPLGPTLPAVVVALMSLAILAAVVAPAIARLSAALREIRQSGHADKVEGYHVLYYSNVNDPRLWVPKLGGIGMTINFAHRWAWPMMLLLLGAPIALAAVSLLSVR